MAEIRIPRDRIPEDILLRLQAIGQSVMFPISGSSPSTHIASNCSLQPVSIITPAPTNTYPIVTSSSSTFSLMTSCQGSTTSVPVATTAAPAQIHINASAAFSPGRSTPNSSSSLQTMRSPKTLPSQRMQFSDRNSTTSSWSTVSPGRQSFETMAQTSSCRSEVGEAHKHINIDEVDGGDGCSVVHVVAEGSRSPNGKQSIESDIVRVFPLEDESDKEITDSQKQQFPVDDDSGIVRLFQTPKRQSSPVGKTLESATEEAPNTVRMFNQEVQSQEEVTTSRLMRSDDGRLNLPQQYDSSIPSPNHRHSHPQANINRRLTPTRNIAKSPSPNHFQSNQKHTVSPLQTMYTINGVKDNLSGTPRRATPSMSMRKHGNFRHSPFPTTASRRSPELPTPPETPDGTEDDEVFCYDDVTLHGDSMERRYAIEAYRLSQESTPRKETNVQLRHSSDSRRYEQRNTQHTSPFTPTQKLSELNVGDRRNTRKRLSFEEDDMILPPSPHTQQYHSDPVLSNHGQINNSYFQPLTSSPIIGRQTLCAQINQHNYNIIPTNQRTVTSTNSQYTCNQGVQSSSHNAFSPIISVQSHSNIQNEALAPPNSPFCKPTSQNIPEVKDIIERLCGPPANPPANQFRPRLHSEGDRSVDHQGFASSCPAYGRGSPALAPPRPRGQTFSHGKRRRLDTYDEHDGPTLTQTPNNYQRPETPINRDSCACATIERNFLQMAECAYKNIRRMDSTSVDFDRFRQELAQTNNILRESLTIIENFKHICEHTGDSDIPGNTG